MASMYLQVLSRLGCKVRINENLMSKAALILCIISTPMLHLNITVWSVVYIWAQYTV